MHILQELFDSMLQEEFSFNRMGAKLIESKFSDLGTTLTEEQLAEIEEMLENIEGGDLTIQIEDHQLPDSGIALQEVREGVFQMQLDSLDVDEFIQRLRENIPHLIEGVRSEVSQVILDELKRDAPQMLKEDRDRRESFEANTRRLWGKALDLLKMSIVIAYETGDDFNEEFRPQPLEEHDHVFDVLTRLHARACQIASEIHTLLSAGYADGAHARWRTLHEISAIGYFVAKHGNAVAERYLCHDAVESYRAAPQYQEHCESLGYEQMSDEKMAELKAARDHLVDRFGRGFGNQYGWASDALRMDDPNFSDIERDVNLEHLRPFYKLASHNVHANPKGVLFKLGLLPGSENLLLAGPSNAGLADPGHLTAISLAQITTLLLTTRPNIDRLVICDILMKLEQETGDAFLAAHKALEQQ